jgi:hypothetical protein
MHKFNKWMISKVENFFKARLIIEFENCQEWMQNNWKWHDQMVNHTSNK